MGDEMKYLHARRDRACGSTVDLGYGKGLKRRPRANGEGIFKVDIEMLNKEAKGVKEHVLKMLEASGHTPLSKDALKKLEDAKEKPLIKPVPTGYPKLVFSVKGVSSQVISIVARQFKSPEELLEFASKNKTPPARVTQAIWDRIVEFTKKTWGKKEAPKKEAPKKEESKSKK